jgi:hypothetical protein
MATLPNPHRQRAVNLQPTNMKKTLVMLGLVGLSLLTNNAHAELGETKQQSAKRYGKPVSSAGHVLYYKHKGYIIAQWFNPSDLCEVVCYFKLQGNISQAESDRMGAANLPSYMHRDDWIEQPDQTANGRMWTSIDGQWFFETDQVQLGTSKYLCAAVLMGTTRGVIQYQTETHGTDVQPVAGTDI